MRRYEQASVISSLLQGFGNLDANCALTIGTSHVYGFESGLGISKVTSECFHLVDVGFLTWTKLSIHIPLKDALEELTVLPANLF